MGTSAGSAGAYQASGHDTSTTKAAISGAKVTVANGDTSALSKVDRSATNATPETGIAKTWDGDKLIQQGQLNASIVQNFGATASKAIGDYAQSKTQPTDDAKLYITLKDQQAQRNLSDAEQKLLARLEDSQIGPGLTLDKAQATLNDPTQQAAYEQWKEGGSARVAAHTAVGALSGGASGLGALQGATGAGLSQASIPAMAEQIDKLDVPKELRNTLVSAASTLTGAVAGGGVGGMTAFNATENNYLSHKQVTDMLAQLRKAKNQDERDAILNGYAQLSKQQSAAISGCKPQECDQIASDIAAGQGALKANASELSNLAGWFNDGKQAIVEKQTGDALKVQSQQAFNAQTPQRMTRFDGMQLSTGVRSALEASSACIDPSCAATQYKQLQELKVSAKGQDAIALEIQMDQLRGQANIMGGCIPNTGCEAIVGVGNVAAGLVGMKTGPGREIPAAQPGDATNKGLVSSGVDSVKDKANTAVNDVLTADFKGGANVAVAKEDITRLVKEHSQNGQNPLTPEAVSSMLKQAQPEGTVAVILDKLKGANQAANVDINFVYPEGSALKFEIKTVANQNSFNGAIEDAFEVTRKTGVQGKASDMVAIQVPAGTDSSTVKSWLDSFWNSSSGKRLGRSGFELGSVVVVDPTGKVLLPLTQVKH